MNSELTSYPLGFFLLGVVGMAYWYYKMFHASGGWDLPQRAGRYRRPKNFDSVIVPSYSMWLILGPVVVWFGQYDPPKWLFICASIPVFLCPILFIVGFLPIKFPDCMYPEWQYAKRNGLLEEGKAGKKSSQNRDCGGGESLMDTQVTMRVASGWRQLSEEERSELGDLGQDESIRFIAVAEATEGYVPNIVITETEVISGKGDKEILDGSAGRLAEPHPGCRLIDDTIVPYPTARTRFVTGVYTLNDVSMTVAQLVWLTRHRNDGDEEPRRFLWAATCTCPSLACPSIIEDFMTMARTVEVES
ncbi:hypothetical protein [Schaalia dentiphila]|jgi:hypothetical protein|uniref:Uncharacterized protein n=1 Tax=Schaalia dentiphila ATCC 17982 TaxID=411466 RepID=A7BE94_9ACTO|nr:MULTISPECIES: hypothetical protein [Schaalia]EDN81518.1 hypothetical protein ACTODO_01996 [Schaalia odontolytica ATCC 17982]